ncbi:phage portal protein [archaeon]|nr:phage portal protein [archaeon]
MEINIKPTYKQYLVWDKLFNDYTKYIMFGGGAGGGKSWLICDWLIYMCFKYPGTKWFLGREELKRLMGSTFITFCKVMSAHNISSELWKLNGQYNYIQFLNGSRIDFLDMKYLPSDPLYERFGSMEFTGGALEEVGEIHFTGFDMLKSRIGRTLNLEYNIPSKILLTCNPKKNWAYFLFYRPWKEKKLDKDKCFIQALYNDNEYTAKQYRDNLSSMSDKVLKQRLMFGLWEYDDDPSRLFEYDSIIDMFTNEAKRGLKYCIVDQSGRGKDRTVITLWDGLFIYKIITMKEGISMQELDKILRQEQIPRSKCLVDEDGVGFGIVKDMTGIKGFVNNASAIKSTRKPKKEKDQEKIETNYANLKSQCWDTLANYVNSGKIGIYKDIPTEYKELIIEDLDHIKQTNMDKDQSFRVTTKEDIKEEIGRSTDCGDTLMMRMMFVLKDRIKVSFAFC